VPEHPQLSTIVTRGGGIFSRGGSLSPDVIIRAALPGELADVGELRVAAYRADGFLAGGSGYEPTLRSLGNSGDGEILVAVRDGQLIGTVTLQRWSADDELLRSPDEAEIRALAVAPAGRRQGTGRALVAAVIDRAAASGVRHLVLCSRTDMHAAHRLYEQAGFRRLPGRDWWPSPDLQLVAYGLILDGRR
jgi:ribosomal protein S18 acetylase RimI-like enzyme